MRPVAKILLMSVAAALAPLPAVAQDSAFVARVNRAFAEFDRPDGPGAAVALVHDGKVVLERGYGLAQLEHGVRITPATVFHVASVSKQFAAFAIVLLAHEGGLGLDDDIRQHLPWVPDLGRRVTVRQLIHHTSGVRDQWELLMMAGWRLDDVITREHITAMMRRQRELNFEPGSEYLYSNMGYSLLAEIVERVSGTTYPEFLQKRIFEPLGMAHTHVHNDHEMIVPNRAYSYRPAGTAWRNSVLSYANQGATSLFTTVGDLTKWLHNFETARVGGPDVIAQMYQRGVLNNGDTISYAFALQRAAYRDKAMWVHSGSDAGFRAVVIHFPAERVGIAVLSNAANANPSRLAQQVAAAWFGDPDLPVATAPAPQPVAQQQPAAQWQPAEAELQAFAGDYYSPELATVYTVEIRLGVLFTSHARLGTSRMVPSSTADTFRAGNRTMRFERKADGTISGFRLTGGRVRNLAFVRLAPGALPR